MNRSNKGFGLAGVFATVVVLIVAAIFSASASSDQTQISQTQQQNN
jgi:type II secretory pathway component PulK